ncbi:hypothetical protein [Trichormus sp. NMC-1]|uniref:hypothetical protein n=1 Tax=Trichormus sp. NMC-1 TaxID=1853259 RepID=UPI001F1AB8B2|nr:hypothetical protein [Trichormus sp. NMC-1]
MTSFLDSQNYQYQFGGSLPPHAPTYVTRKADEDLYQAVKAGEYSTIFRFITSLARKRKNRRYLAKITFSNCSFSRSLCSSKCQSISL